MRNMKRIGSSAWLGALLLAASPQDSAPETLAFKAARLIPVEGEEMAPAIMIVRNGKIDAVGSDVSIPEGAHVIDFGPSTLMPGLVDAGLTMWVDGEDNEEASEVTPGYRALDGLNAGARDFQRAVQTGVTTAFVAPGTRNVIGGLGVVLKMAGSSMRDRVLLEDAALKATIGSGPSRGNYPPRGRPPGNVYARRPTTRMGVSWIFRKAFLDAQSAGTEADGVLARALRKQLPVRIAASRAMDIESAIYLADEFGLAVSFEEAEEAYRAIDLLVSRKIPVALRPTFQPSGLMSADGSEIRYDTFAALAAAGVPTALLAGGPGEGESLLRMAAFAVRYGASRAQALRAITRTPADMLGVGDRVGSIQPGKDADFLVLTGDPLDPTSRVERVFIGGRQVLQ
ncbi:MAG: amidohydrolase family protein [Planctomycetes bacterium]|nr:amidohydrolase family protein [Planctomycetota bacterium]